MAEETGSAPAGNPVAEAAAPAATPAAAPAPATPPTSDGWLSAVSDPDLKEWATSKGMQNATPDNVLGSYRNLEKLMGADKAGRTVVLAGDDASDAERNAFYSKLGRPDTADGYEINPPEGEDGSFAKWASETFHGLGLSKKQAAGIAEAWEARRAETIASHENEKTVTAESAVSALKKEWGAAYDLKVAGIDIAAAKLGFTTPILKGLRAGLGTVEAMKFIDSLNSKMGDHRYDSGESAMAGALTPAAARAALNALLGDKEFNAAWSDKMHPGHKAAIEKKAALARQATGMAA